MDRNAYTRIPTRKVCGCKEQIKMKTSGLFQAISEGRLRQARYILDSGLTPNIKCDQGQLQALREGGQGDCAH